VMVDAPSQHYPDRLEIELHVDRENIAESTGFSIPLYRGGTAIWHQGLDAAGEIDVRSWNSIAARCRLRWSTTPSRRLT